MIFKRHNALLRFSLSLIPVLLLIGGCRSDRVPPKGMPKLSPCVIAVTQEGEPLVGAIVGLHPQGFSLEWTVRGKTDETGAAIIFTDGYFKGAPAGDYKVTIDKLEAFAPPLPDVLPTSEAELAQLYDRIEAETKDYRLVEPVYAKVDSTPLSISVEKKKAEVSFDVGKKFRSVAE